MKLRKLTLVLAVVAMATLVLAGSAAADPPKEDFYFRWGPPDEAIWVEFGGEDFCPVPTGEAWHSDCGTWPWYIVDSTNPLISGVYVWEIKNLSTLYYDPWEGFWPQPQMQGTWQIVPLDGTDGYWEGTFQSVGNWQFDFNTVVSKSVGEGHGVYEGYLFKGEYYLEPATPETSPYGYFWPVMKGVIIPTGQVK